MPPVKREETSLSDSHVRVRVRTCVRLRLLLSETAGITYGNSLIASFQSVPLLSLTENKL